MEFSFSDITFNQLVAKPSQKTVVVCVNNRYARRMLEQFNQLLGDDNQTVAIPSIVPQHAWIQNLANTLCFQENNKFAKHVFSGFAAQQLWQKIIKEQEKDDYFLSVNQMAKLAFEANNLIHEWDIKVNPEEHSPDYERFILWQNAYKQYLSSIDAEDINLTYEHICDCLDKSPNLNTLENLILVGFNQVSPRISTVLIKLQALGINIYKYNNDNQITTDIHCFQVEDEQAEWQQAILWAKENLLENPDSKFAIIVPNPSENVHYIHRLMHQYLVPEGLKYNVAAAPSLCDWPIVNAINQWLALLYKFSKDIKCDAGDVGQALLSLSVLNNRGLNSWAASLDSKLRHAEIFNLSYDKFKELISNNNDDFIEALDGCLQLIKRAENTTIDHHVDLVRRLLSILGFVDNIELDSVNWQCLQSFDQGLNDLLNLSPVFGGTDFYTVIQVLGQLTQSITFQPQRDINSRLDVLGFLEAEGGYWDGVWVLGLTDKVFPAQAQPNPLIPWAAMQRSNAPRSTPERELLWAQNSLAHILQSANSVRFSHAQLSGDETLEISPLLNIKNWPYTSLSANKPHISHTVLENIEDNYGPKLNHNKHDGSLKGGVSVLDTQSRNPLWAFVKYRLRATELPNYAQGFNAMIRGTILHECMRLIWLNLQDKQGLISAKNDNKLDNIIINAFEEVTHELKQKHSPGLDSELIHELELNRTIKVINDWLDLEIQREDEFRPIFLEHQDYLTHNGLKLTYRVDRIDELEDGRKLIIDYKSGAGQVSIHNNWSRERLIDLQLPLYATCFDADELAGLAFVRLNSRVIDAYGVSDGDCGIQKIKHHYDIKEFNQISWQDLLSKWRTSTRKLIDEYANGYAANEFINKSDIDYCDVLPFLRLQKNQND